MGTKFGSIDIESWPGIKDEGLSDSISEEPQKNEEILKNKIEDYISNLEINDKKIKIINERRNELEQLLSNELNIIDKHIIGSYARNTMIDSVEGNDVDIMIVIDEKIHGDWMDQTNGPTNCLQYVKNIIQKDSKFKDAEMSIDKNAVTIKYPDFNIDIVPAFKDKLDGYRIPDTHGEQSWIRTNPRMFKKMMSASDKANNGRTSNIAKMVKGWNEMHGKPLKSFHIETMVYNHFKNRQKIEGKSIYEDVKDFFSRLPWYIRSSTYEPVYGERVDKYLSYNNRETAIRKAQLALSKIAKAESYKNERKTDKCINNYKKVFGARFK